MDEKHISYLAFESVTSRQERTIRRLWILCIILIIALLGTNAGWLYYENQYVDEICVEQDVEATADRSGDIHLNTVGGDYFVGESESASEGN